MCYRKESPMLNLIKATYQTAWKNALILLLFLLAWVLMDTALVDLREQMWKFWTIGLMQLLALIVLYQFLLGHKINPLVSLRVFFSFLFIKIATASVAILPAVFFYWLARSLQSVVLEYLSFLAGGLIAFYILARFTIALPMVLDQNETPLRDFWQKTNEPKEFWWLMGIVFYLPAVLATTSLPGSIYVNFAVTELFSLIATVFSVEYYRKKFIKH